MSVNFEFLKSIRDANYNKACKNLYQQCCDAETFLYSRTDLCLQAERTAAELIVRLHYSIRIGDPAKTRFANILWSNEYKQMVYKMCGGSRSGWNFLNEIDSIRNDGNPKHHGASIANEQTAAILNLQRLHKIITTILKDLKIVNSVAEFKEIPMPNHSSNTSSAAHMNADKSVPSIKTTPSMPTPKPPEKKPIKKSKWGVWLGCLIGIVVIALVVWGVSRIQTPTNKNQQQFDIQKTVTLGNYTVDVVNGWNDIANDESPIKYEINDGVMDNLHAASFVFTSSPSQGITSLDSYYKDVFKLILEEQTSTPFEDGIPMTTTGNVEGIFFQGERMRLAENTPYAQRDYAFIFLDLESETIYSITATEASMDSDFIYADAIRFIFNSIQKK